jgi:predicted small metal-binding protein
MGARLRPTPLRESYEASSRLRRGQVLARRCDVAKILRCGDVVPGCDTVIVGKDVDEVFAKAEDHARKEHNMMIIPPSVSAQIAEAIKDKA